MSGGALELFTVAARMVLNKEGFDQGVHDADSAGKGLSEKLTGYMEKVKNVLKASAIVATVTKGAQAIWGLAKDTAAAGDRIDKMSQRLGLSRRAFQEWDYVLSQNGIDIDSMGMSMKAMGENIMANSADTAAALSQLGLSAAHLQGLSPEEQMEEIVRAFQAMPDGADKSRLAMQIFGRQAQQLMPLLNGAEGSLDELRQRANDLGLIMSDEDVDASVAFGDALDDLKTTFEALKMKFGAQLLPGFTKHLIAAANALGRISNAVSDAFKTGKWGNVFKTITEEIRNFVPGIIETIVNVASGLFEHADTIIDLAVSIVEGLADGILKSVPVLVRKLPQIFKSILSGVTNLAKSLGNTVIDIINNVLGTNIPHLDEIKWPSWEDVKHAAGEAWKLIQKGLEKVFIFLFGEDENGGIKWPKPEEIWAKIQQGLTVMWNGIQAAATEILKFVFGEDENGGIAWPSAEVIWAKISEGLSALWGGIQRLALGVLKFVFGEDEDGGIKFPTGTEVREKILHGLKVLWEGEDGNGGIKGAARNILTFIFGSGDNGGIEWPSPNEAWQKIRDGFAAFWGRKPGEGLRGFLEGATKWILQLFGLPDSETLDIEGIVGEWWTAVGERVQAVCSWVLGLFGFADKDEYKEHFRKWWEGDDGNGGVKSIIRGVADWVLGKLGLPKVSEIRRQIQDWWDNKVVPGLRLFIFGSFGGVKGLFGVDEEDAAGKTGGELLADSLTEEQRGWASNSGQYADLLNDPDSWIYDEHAKGLNYVPWDGYRASLHRGEMVLNQAQSRRYRENSGGINTQELYRAVASAVSEAISGIQVNMDGRSVGGLVAGYVSQSIYQQQQRGRYSAT